MSTLKQKELAKAIVENAQSVTPKTAGQLLENIGYSKSTAKAIPGEIIEAKGVQEELVRLGFTEDKAKETVAKIMNDESVDPNSRLKAADMTFKVHGSYAPDKSLNLNMNVDVRQDPKAKEIGDKYEAELLNTLQND